MILEVIRMVKEDGAMLSIQSVQLTWKLNLSPTCWSGTPFCRNLLLPTNDFVGSGDNLLACGWPEALAFFSLQWIQWQWLWESRRCCQLLVVWVQCQAGEGGGILEVIRIVRRGRCYAVNSKHSIDLKTQFVAHVLIWYTILPKPPFINKWFRGLRR